MVNQDVLDGTCTERCSPVNILRLIVRSLPWESAEFFQAAMGGCTSAERRSMVGRAQTIMHQSGERQLLCCCVTDLLAI